MDNTGYQVMNLKSISVTTLNNFFFRPLVVLMAILGLSALYKGLWIDPFDHQILGSILTAAWLMSPFTIWAVLAEFVSKTLYLRKHQDI